jgi:hypothetical protein
MDGRSDYRLFIVQRTTLRSSARKPLMSDAKPKRPARDPGPGSSDPVPEVTTEAAAAPGADAAPPEPVAPESAPAAATADAATVLALAEPAAPFIEPGAAAIDSWTVLAEAQAAVVRGFEQIAVEVTGMTRFGITSSVDAAMALSAAQSFAEAVEINAGLARRNADAMIEGSARVSEIGVKIVAEASRPILSRLGVA